jgi:hypothetical protein
MLWHAVNHGLGRQIPIKASALKLEPRRFSTPLGGTLSLVLSIIDDYSIEGEQVSEHTR